MIKPCCSNFRVITANFSDVRIFRIFTVHVNCDGADLCESTKVDDQTAQ